MIIKKSKWDCGCEDKYSVNTDKNKIKVKRGAGYVTEFIGTLAADLVDTGDGLVINFVDEQTIHLDYCQAEYLRNMLKMYHKHLEPKVNKE